MVDDTPTTRLSAAIDKLVKARKEFSAPELAALAGVSRQAAQQRLRRLVESGALDAAGKARARRYFAPGASSAREVWRYRNESLEEDAIWRELRLRSRHLKRLRGRSLEILRYAFTEIMNNAIDHSGSREVAVAVEPSGDRIAIEVIDEGVGIWRQIQTAYGLGSPTEALAELSKGKVTTKPERHSGEGIFFVSKAVDLFQIESGGLRWAVDNIRDDIATGTPEGLIAGTKVRFEVARATTRSLEELFASFTTEYEFDKTRTLVRLFAHGTSFVSRSEAKRVVAGLERFKEVILDFDRVGLVGQAFADEVFRVWATEHPGTMVRPVNMSEGVRFMVDRAVRAATETRGPGTSAR